MMFYVSVFRPVHEDGGYTWREEVEYTGERHQDIGAARAEMDRAKAEGLDAWINTEEDEE